VPDFRKCAEMYLKSTEQPVEMYVMGGHSDENDFHKSLWDQNSLTDALKAAGLNDIRTWSSTIPDNAARDISINLEGFKRSPLKIEGVQAIISMPRLAFTENCFSWLSIVKLGIPVTKSTGVFWSQCMTRMMEITKDVAGTKYLLTLDYDTVFRQRDVEDLYILMEANPDASAISSVQMGRDRNSVLLTKKGPDGKNQSTISSALLQEELMQIDTAHFGLTMIRVDAINQIPKPWFLDVPDQDGQWGENRVDADIYFWKRFHDAGLKLFQANRVVVGHLQQVVTWPSRNYQPVFQYLPDFQKGGMPWPCAR